jgi:predicted NUDIX family NTP pyrophosphohydrolase
VEWFGLEEARRKLIVGQVPFIAALEQWLAAQEAELQASAARP